MTTTARETTAPAAGAPLWRTRHWTDWVGSLACAGFAFQAAVRSGGIGIFMIPTFVHELMVAALFLTRGRPVRRETALLPQAVAYATTFIVPLFVAAAAMRQPAWIAWTPNDLMVRAGVTVWLFGALMAIWPLWYMRGAFSIAPQARNLVTTGPYAAVRHPIYSAYIFQYVGLWLSHATLPLGIALLAWGALLIARVGFEERVLSAAHPEYAAYRARAGRFFPRLRVARPAAAVAGP